MERSQETNTRRDFHRTLVAIAAGALAAPAMAESAATELSADKALIRETIGHYFKGHATGEGAYMLKAFLPTAHIEGVREGKFSSWTLTEYVAGFKGTPPADEATRTRTIDAIDISGTAATARATLGSTTFLTTDFFLLLKIDGEWKIANKVYSAQKR